MDSVFCCHFAFELARLTLSFAPGKGFCNTIFVGFGFWLLILLKFCRQSDFLLSSESFEGLKLSVKPLHLLAQVDVVVLYLHLELVQVFKLLPLLTLQLVLLLQTLDSTTRRVPSVLQRSSPLNRPEYSVSHPAKMKVCHQISLNWRYAQD